MGQKFDNVYLRCNLGCDGTTPETGSHAESPDMFSSGIEAIPDFQKALSTPESYEKQPEDKSVVERVNYCYLRCKNNTDKIISAKAQLFYTDSSVVLWPDSWKPMKVDFKEDTLNDIRNISPGGIGVVERPFIWNMPSLPRTGSHYCYIGRLSTEETPNPIPPVEHPIEMSSLMQNNLMYAQRNIEIIKTDPGHDGFYNVVISASKELQKPSIYHLFFYPYDIQGWDVEITCSMTDSEGEKIGQTRTNIPNNKHIYCGQCLLEPGFNAVITVYIYYNGIRPKATSKSKFVLEYAVPWDEIPYAKKMGVYNEPHNDLLMKCANSVNSDISRNTAAFASMGDYTTYFQAGN